MDRGRQEIDFQVRTLPDQLSQVNPNPIDEQLMAETSEIEIRDLIAGCAGINFPGTFQNLQAQGSEANQGFRSACRTVAWPLGHRKEPDCSKFANFLACHLLAGKDQQGQLGRRQNAILRHSLEYLDVSRC